MIRKVIGRMLFAQIFSALTVTLCLMIDSIIVGRYLGVEALSAYQLANPVLLILAAMANTLSAGIQVVCSRSLGKGSQEETNAGYSCAFILGIGSAVLIMLLILVFRTGITKALGAGSEGSLFTQTRDYMTAFVIGAPAMVCAMCLAPFLQISGRSGLLVAAVGTMTVTDIVLDLLVVKVFHNGMFGMGLASAISYYCAVLVGGWYFLSKKCMFRFSFRLVSAAKIRELLVGGFPTLLNLAATVVMMLLLNRILLGTGGSDAVAAFSVVTSIGNAGMSISTGISGVSMTVSGIFYNEEDRTGMLETFRVLVRYSLVLGFAAGAVLILCAPLFARLFITEAGDVRNMAAAGIRIYAAGLVPCCIVNSLRTCYQATEKERLTGLISVLEGMLLPVFAGFIMSRFLGTTGVWFYFVLGELLSLLVIGLLIRFRTGKLPWQDGAFLLLKDDFGVPADQLMEADVRTLEDAVRVSREADAFCRSRGEDGLLSRRISLCIEEMAGNIVEHGFTKDEKEHHLSVRLLQKDAYWVIRFRDDCRAFDPVHYTPGEGKDALGIRLMLAMAEDAQYTSSMSLNNLMLKLPGKETACLN